MKERSDRCLLIISLTLCVMMFLLFFCPNSFAEEEITSGRRLWDNIMLWVNFGILAFFFMKYAKKPLLTFLSGERLKVEDNIIQKLIHPPTFSGRDETAIFIQQHYLLLEARNSG